VTWELSSHPEVEADLSEASDYYAEIGADLADSFINEAETAVSFIGQYPEAGRSIYTRYRRVALDRFPYLVCYRVVGGAIRVLAVVHDRRDPKWVRARLASRSLPS